MVQWIRIACQCRGHWFDPWPRKTPHALKQLSSCAITTEPWYLDLYSTTREATTRRRPCTATKSSPHSLQLEKPCTQQWRPSTTKNKLFLQKKHIYSQHLSTQRCTINVCWIELQMIIEDHYSPYSPLPQPDWNYCVCWLIMCKQELGCPREKTRQLETNFKLLNQHGHSHL